ncbi:MAG: UvrB/UvrC motif-containing protein [Candidatus Zapsychrus exili]|nr:UvrB/UvrC motif-containing protein [Candidatus Zapsychrus exili]
MLCDICNKKKASVHLTEIVDGQMAELHLCEGCSKEKSVQMEQQFGLADLLAGLADFGKHQATPEETPLVCSNCNLSYEDFRKFGRLGCSNCYQTFEVHLAPLLKKIHGSNKHLGKKPLKVVVTSQNEEECVNANSLKQLLSDAIEREDFEDAAMLRDKIRELENEGGE